MLNNYNTLALPTIQIWTKIPLNDAHKIVVFIKYWYMGELYKFTYSVSNILMLKLIYIYIYIYKSMLHKLTFFFKIIKKLELQERL